jgi:outer membrane murein-binding lipoprotein Lpp
MSTKEIVLEQFESPVNAIIHSRQEAELAEAARIARQEKLEADAIERARLEHLSTVASTLGSAVADLSGKLTALRDDAIAGIADQMTDALGQVFPALLSDVFAREVAAASIQVATEGFLSEATLIVHPDDHDCLAEALAAIGAPCPITVTTEPDQIAGTAQLRWGHGGADFDTDKIVDAARSVLARHLQSFPRSTQDHE